MNAQDLMKTAESGSIPAMLELGYNYEHGISNFPQDATKAFQWYEKAALLGNAEAANILGDYYMIGSGTERSMKKALQWYQIAARKGNRFAQRRLDDFKNVVIML